MPTTECPGIRGSLSWLLLIDSHWYSALMPKRTNEFQQLIHLLHHQFSEAGSLEESAFLTDRDTGSQVEVDVLVRSTCDKIPITIAVECRAHRRPQTLEWVREMQGKYARLPVDKVVLVSKSGFTPDAVVKATSERMVTLSLEEAQTQEWRAMVRGLANLKLGLTEIRPVPGSIAVSLAENNQHFFPVGTATNCRQRQDAPTVTLAHCIMGLFHNPKFYQQLIKTFLSVPREGRFPRHDLDIGWSLEPSLEIQDSESRWHKVARIKMKAEFSVESTELKLEAASYSQAEIAYGTAANIIEKEAPKDSKITVVMSPEKKGAISVPQSDKSGSRIFPMIFPVCEE